MIVEIGDRFFFTKTMYAAFILNLTIHGISGAKIIKLFKAVVYEF
jgi:hypothetical protein